MYASAFLHSSSCWTCWYATAVVESHVARHTLLCTNDNIAHVVMSQMGAAGDPAVARQLLQLLSRGGDGVRAFVSGITWELAAAPLPAQQLLEAGAVPALLGVVQATAAAAGARSGKKGSKGKKKGDSSSKDGAAGKAGQQKEGSKGAAAGKAPEAGSQPASELLQDPAAAAAVALCNATGECWCSSGQGILIAAVLLLPASR